MLLKAKTCIGIFWTSVNSLAFDLLHDNDLGDRHEHLPDVDSKSLNKAEHGYGQDMSFSTSSLLNA